MGQTRLSELAILWNENARASWILMIWSKTEEISCKITLNQNVTVDQC